MKSIPDRKDINTVTGVFATREDAENAYQALLDLRYNPNEITLVMSRETRDKLFTDQNVKTRRTTRIAAALEKFGTEVTIPGLALVVAGNLADNGMRTMMSSVLSDQYAEYFQGRIADGEILIDFGLHTAKEKNRIIHLWENYGGDPLVRRVSIAA